MDNQVNPNQNTPNPPTSVPQPSGTGNQPSVPSGTAPTPPTANQSSSPQVPTPPPPPPIANQSGIANSSPTSAQTGQVTPPPPPSLGNTPQPQSVPAPATTNPPVNQPPVANTQVNQPPTVASPQANQPQPAQENPSLQTQSQRKQTSGSSPLRKILAIIIGLLIVIGGAAAAYFYFVGGGPSISLPGSTNNPGENNGNQPVGLVPPGESVTLEYWGLWEPESTIRPVLDEFEAQNPGLTIVYRQESPQEYRERLQSALARQEGPDIFRIHNTWVPMLRNELSGLPTSIMSVSQYQQTFYPIISQDMLSDNQIVGMPLMIDGLGLYYNTAMFETAGKQVPKTWDELRRTAVDLTITSNGEVERAGISLGLTSNVDNFSDILGLMLLQNGANPADPTSSLALDAINFYLLFSKTDGLWNDTLPPSTFAFANEKAAMIIAPSWRAHEILALNPDLEFEIAVLPQLPDRDVAWATYWVESVSNQSQHQEIAWALLKFMTEKESLRTMYTQASNERLFGNPFPRVDMADQLIGDPHVGAYIRQAPIAESWPMASRTFDNGLNDRIIKYYEDMINAGPSTTSLQTVTNGVTKVLTQYGVNPN